MPYAQLSAPIARAVRRIAGCVLSAAILPHAAHAAVLTVAGGDVPGLVAAITTANGTGTDTISLAAGSTYALTVANNGSNGLPVWSPPRSRSLATVRSSRAPAPRPFASSRLAAAAT